MNLTQRQTEALLLPILFLLCSCTSTEERDMRGVQKILMAKAGPNPVPIPKEIYQP